MLDIREMDGQHYIFEDVAELLWPGDYDHSNHAAQDRVVERLVEKGAHKPEGYGHYVTPYGSVGFDSESGAFEVHGPLRAVQYVKTVIEEMLKERADARKVLA